MPNAIAYLALLAWPAVCLVLFRTLKVERALIWSILGGYLILPPLAEFNFPLVPAMDKVTIPNLSVLAIMLFGMREKLRLWPDNRIAQLLVVGLVLCTIPTVLTNGDAILFEVLQGADPIVFFVDALPGQSVRDIGSVLIAQVLTLVPFLLARQFLSTEAGLRELLLAFMIGALAYSIPSLTEIRLSPQMNIWVYGFFQHDFAQTIRGQGFRPIVFLPHGLWLAMFICTGVIAAAALARAAPNQERWKTVMLLAYLFVLLVLCKSAASLVYGLFLVPLVLFVPTRWQIGLAATFAVIALTYPMLRNFGIIPLDAILAQAEAFSPERAQSLGYRFFNEEQLLGRAAEKPAFGWGGWGRSLLRDSETGTIVTIPDGRWIIVFGTFGWLGYLSEFGLLALPLILMGVYIRRQPQAALSPFVGPVALILGITMMDMLLNATLTPVTWLVAGAVLGHAERLSPRVPQAPPHALQSRPALDGQARPGPRTVL
ncbi:hypothetical protein [Sulfitobacter sp. SK012]|uniref:hypothetical protein n=1 Tax=Sulfitobacter sp. SK012 TaxID=1389005 RepID=UPI001C200551|nr:hypothetical protein [Sulfitobacter sp. SK012]